jgi:hypothetical protein
MSAPNPEDRAALQREIQAAIAAGRALDPEMDQHIADSAVDRYTKDKAARERTVGLQAQQAAAMPRQPNPNVELVVRSLFSLVILGGIIFAIAHTGGAVLWQFWWLIFIIGPLLGGWRGRRWSSRRRSYAYGGGYQAPQQIPDEDAERRQREAKRQAKIDRLESELKQLKRDDYV